MARKRKIPARKHHGVRDPLKQLEEKEKKLSKVTNNPPDRDNQKVSYKFIQFQKLLKDTEAGKKLKKIHKGKESMPKQQSSSKKISNIRQLREETDEDYLKRVNRITNESLKEAQYEAKYGVNVIRNPKTGEISIRKKPKNEIDELLKEKQKQIRIGKGKSAKNKKGDQIAHIPIDPKVAKDLIKQAIKEDNEERAKEKTSLKEYKHDTIAFGEVVHSPPSFSTLPRRAQKSETVPRPGKKSNLLLQSLLYEASHKKGENKPKTAAATSKTSSGKVEKIALSGKRKALPLATRKMLEDERGKFIEIYRGLKENNKQSSESRRILRTTEA